MINDKTKIMSYFKVIIGNFVSFFFVMISIKAVDAKKSTVLSQRKEQKNGMSMKKPWGNEK